MSDVKIVQNEAGDYFVGFDVGDHFVSFAHVSASRVQHATERAESLTERLKGDDRAASEAVEALPISSKAKSKTNSGKDGEK